MERGNHSFIFIMSVEWHDIRLTNFCQDEHSGAVRVSAPPQIHNPITNPDLVEVALLVYSHATVANLPPPQNGSTAATRDFTTEEASNPNFHNDDVTIY